MSWFCRTSTWISHRYIFVPPTWTTPTSLPTLYRVVPVHGLWVTCFMHWTCIWPPILHMVTYIFQCYSLKSPHPQIGIVFLTALVHFLSLCYILVFLTVFRTFSLLPSYLLWWSLLSVLFYLFFPNFYNLHVFLGTCRHVLH